MRDNDGEAKALFLTPEGRVYSDSLICSGTLPAELGGKQCAFSQAGRIPYAVPLKADDLGYTIDKGRPGDLCPPCATQQLAHLGHWQGHGGLRFPEELLPLRLFNCRLWFWLAVPGLYDADPTRLSPNGRGGER